MSSINEKRKTSLIFKKEWLEEIVETQMPTSIKTVRVKIGEIFIYSIEKDEVMCNFCSEVKATGEFSSGKKWCDWRLDYLKRHLKQKVHTDSVLIIRNRNGRGILRIFNETPEAAKMRADLTERKRSDRNMVKILIDNVILGIQINTSMLSMQTIHNHMAKYVSIPNSWRSKNYAYEFVESINFIIKEKFMNELRKSSFHTLTIDESTDISVQKLLIIYMKYRPECEFVYRNEFCGILKLTGCDSISIVEAIKVFYAENNLDLQKMVLFTSDGLSVMLGKNNGVAARLRHEIKHLSEQHCVAHKEDLAIDDAWKQVSIMQDIETLLRTAYTMFHRSSVRKEQFQEMANLTECDALAFRPLNEVRWLSRHFAVKSLILNSDTLIEHCTEKVQNFNDPISKYCLKTLENPQYRVAIEVLNEVLCELAAQTKLFQRSGLTSLEALQFAKATINKLKSQYLNDVVYWSDDARKVLALSNNIDTAAIIRFIELLCKHLESRFPDEDFMEWYAFDPGAMASNTTNF